MIEISWYDVYLELKRVLEDKEFQKNNRITNPNTPEDAISVALYQLNREYSHKATEACREEYQLY